MNQNAKKIIENHIPIFKNKVMEFSNNFYKILFEYNNNAKLLFKENSLKNDEQIKDTSFLFVSIFENVNNIDKIIPIIKEFVNKHMNINSNIKIDSCQIIKEAFLSSFKKTYNEIATNELITAYSDIYDLISRELCDKKNNSGYKNEHEFIQDPWARITTRNGLAGDEVISSLQKCIRRGLVEDACKFAYEMYITSPQMEDKLWRRLVTITVEDIGMGDVNAPILINTLNEMRKNYAYADGDRPIFFIHAIRYLCACQKDRSSDLLKNIVIKSFAMGFIPEIPDFALDKHTIRGAKMGRDSFHFLNEASKVIPQLPIDNDYKQRYEEILKTYNPDNVCKSAFKYNPWQE